MSKDKGEDLGSSKISVALLITMCKVGKLQVCYNRQARHSILLWEHWDSVCMLIFQSMQREHCCLFKNKGFLSGNFTFTVSVFNNVERKCDNFAIWMSSMCS